MKVSIVIPCYNLGQFLKDAIASVNNQSFKSWELIVVDDGSTDPTTQSILKSLAREHLNFRFVSQKNAGVGAARNHGISLARGKYIVCLDADDELAPDYLEKTVRTIESDKTGKVTVVTTWLREFDERANLWRTDEFNVSKLLMTNLLHVSSLFSKQAWELVGGYNEDKRLQAYADWDFWLRMVEHGYRWATIKEPLFRYRIRKNSMLATSKDAHLEMFMQLYDLHKRLYGKYADELIPADAQLIKSLHDEISEKNAAIEEFKKAVDYYQAEAMLAEERYQNVVRYQVIKFAIKLGKLLAKISRKLLHIWAQLMHRSRRLIPKYVRELYKGANKKLFPVRVTVIKNHPWPSDRPLVSIVTPYYNNATTILETVQSVLNQTYQDFEYTIIDDGSEKSQSAVLEEIKDKRVNVVYLDENAGHGSPAVARNLGVKESTGKYIVCLDADDALDPTYLEKCLVVLETNPNAALITTDTQNFGDQDSIFSAEPYNPKNLSTNNMVITAAMYKRQAWEKAGGYKEGIGYEDWEFWINLAEQGCWGVSIPEPLFRYRVVPISRFVKDRIQHREHVHMIADLHPKYKQTISKLQKADSRALKMIDPATAFTNLAGSDYRHPPVLPKILIAIPWMPFGGAETLILNFTKEIKDIFNISFITGLKDSNEWEYKFKEISDQVYHLPNLFKDDDLALEFISNFITTRKIDALHIIHTGFLFKNLAELKKRHSKLKILMTCFNDRAHFSEAVELNDYIDFYSTDNQAVANHFHEVLPPEKSVTVIPNGIDCFNNFNPNNFDRNQVREELGLSEDDLAVLFFGRLSKEKNLDVFVEVAQELSKHTKLKFFVIGDGPLKPIVEAAAAKLNSLTYLGYQSQVARYLSAVDIFVLPSAIEGFPLSILEAMAMNLVVIASDVGAVSDVIADGKSGFIVTPGSAEEIAKEILELLSNRNQLTKVKVNARLEVEHKYSNTALGNSYMALYNKVIKS